MIPALLSLISLAAALPTAAPGITIDPRGASTGGTQKPNTTGFIDPHVSTARGGYAICVSGVVPVTASAQNIKLNYPLPSNQTQVTQTFLDFVSDGPPDRLQKLIGGIQNVSGAYNISATMCLPANGTISSTVQFLTHGVGFDRYYWDWAAGYSYADYAARQGYASFFYDRLGVGLSSKADPIQTVQAPLEVEIAAELVRLLRNGHFGGKKFTSVVGTGHSFGSIITQAITVQYPALLDAAVLTGFTLNSTGLPNFISGINLEIASKNAPHRFASLNNGYLVSSTAISNQIAFFHSPGFDPKVLSLAEDTKSTVTIGELFTTTAVTRPAANYTGLVAVVNGEADLPFCLGNCSYPINKSALVQPALYPRSKNATNSVYVAPDVGHGINLHYSATSAYKFIQDFVKNNGL